MNAKIPRRISDRLAGQIEKAIARHAQGDNVEYDIAVIPTPDGLVAHCIAVTMPGALLGTVDVAQVMINALQTQQPQVDAIVQNAIEQLRNKRSQDLAAAGMPSLNGHTPS